MLHILGAAFLITYQNNYTLEMVKHPIELSELWNIPILLGWIITRVVCVYCTDRSNPYGFWTEIYIIFFVIFIAYRYYSDCVQLASICVACKWHYQVTISVLNSSVTHIFGFSAIKKPLSIFASFFELLHNLDPRTITKPFYIYVYFVILINTCIYYRNTLFLNPSKNNISMEFPWHESEAVSYRNHSMQNNLIILLIWRESSVLTKI